MGGVDVRHGLSEVLTQTKPRPYTESIRRAARFTSEAEVVNPTDLRLCRGFSASEPAGCGTPRPITLFCRQSEMFTLGVHMGVVVP